MSIEGMRERATSVPALLVAASLAGPAPVRVTLLFENADVKTYDLVIAPGVHEPGFHDHLVPYVYVALEAGTAKIRKPDGSAETIQYSPGQAYFGAAER